MRARRLPIILLPLTLQEALENTRIYSVTAGGLPENPTLISHLPFRLPHYAELYAALFI